MAAIDIQFSRVKSSSFKGKDLELRLKNGGTETISFPSRKEMMNAAREWVNESLSAPSASPEMEAIKACRSEIGAAI